MKDWTLEKAGKTAVKRKTPSKPLLKLLNLVGLSEGLSIFDYGCGHGKDLDYLRELSSVANLNWDVQGYDPIHRPIPPTHDEFDIVLCTYVLNTVPDYIQSTIIQDIIGLGNRQGKVFVTVRRDIPEEGTDTQRWVELPWKKLYECKQYVIYYI